MHDLTELIGGSLVRHDPGNDRILLMDLRPGGALEIVHHLERLASSFGYAKVRAVVPAGEVGTFVAGGYHLEAVIPRFFRDGSSACYLARYLRQGRSQEFRPLELKEVLAAVQAQPRASASPLPGGFAVRRVRMRDVHQITALYRESFPSGTLPSHDAVHLRRNLKQGVHYCGVWQGARLAAAACANLDSSSCSAELADFATLPEYRGHGCTQHLLQRIEQEIRADDVRCVYSFASAYSPGMNLAFARSGYRLAGTLTNDCYLGGRLESMNLWHKDLSEDPGLAWRSLFEEDDRSRRVGAG